MKLQNEKKACAAFRLACLAVLHVYLAIRIDNYAGDYEFIKLKFKEVFLLDRSLGPWPAAGLSGHSNGDDIFNWTPVDASLRSLLMYLVS